MKIPFIKPIILLPIPVVFLVIALAYETNMGPTYQFGIDPEYTYLFNALNMATGQFNVGHIHHPGTPVQVLGAVTIRCFHPFMPNTALMYEVLGNPEIYLHRISVAIILLTFVVLLLISRRVHQITNKLYPVLFLQLISLSTWGVANHYMGRVIPEPMLIIPTLLLSALIAISLYYPNRYKYHLLFAIPLALGMATKIIFGTLLFLPFFLIRGAKKRMLFLALTLGCFLLFAFPVLIKMADFSTWISELFINNGTYGSGDATILKPEAILPRLVQILEMQTFFFMAIALSIGGLLLTDKSYNGSRSVLWGILVSYSALILFVIKHWGPHYLLTGALILPLTALLLGRFYAPYFQRLSKRVLTPLPYVVVLFAISFLLNFHIQNILQFKTRKQSSLKSIETIHKITKNQKVFIFQGYVNSAFNTGGLHHGYCVSGKNKKTFQPVMDSLYSGFFILPTGGTRLYSWNHWVTNSIKDFVGTSESGFIYTPYKEDYRLDKLREMLSDDYSDAVTIVTALIYSDTIANHYLYSYRTSLKTWQCIDSVNRAGKLPD